MEALLKLSLNCQELEKVKGPKVLFDGDEIVYKCGFAAQEKLYKVKGLGEFRYKKDIKAALKAIDLDYRYVEIDVETIIHPLPHALQNVNTFFSEHLGELKSSNYKVYLSGGKNFRDKIATIQKYKGNRNPSSKPHWYNEIREYLVNNHGAEVTDGIEADDAIGIEAYKDFVESEGKSELSKTIVCSQDKDLKMIPGWNYNPNSRKLIWIDLEDAEYNFWFQVLMGDSSDNIPGVRGIGWKLASYIVKKSTSRDELYELVYDEYCRSYNWNGDLAVKHIDEVCKLLWILREPGVTWDGTEI